MGSPVISRSAAAVVAVLLTVTLAACEDEPEPDFSDDVTASGTPIPPATSSATTAPDDEPSLTPEQTVRAWVDAYNAALFGEPAGAVFSLSTDTCQTCEDLVEPILKRYENGGGYETKGWRVINARKDPKFNSNSNVLAAVKVAAGRTFDDATSKPEPYEAERHILQFGLVKRGAGWRVDFVGFIS